MALVFVVPAAIGFLLARRLGLTARLAALGRIVVPAALVVGTVVGAWATAVEASRILGSSPPRHGSRRIPAVELRSLAAVEPFTTKDGSTIRELHHTPAQSLAEATLEAGQATQRHYHALTEEIYLLTGGGGVLEVDGESRDVGAGDAMLIPPGAWHELSRARRARGFSAVRAAVLARRHVLRLRRVLLLDADGTPRSQSSRMPAVCVGLGSLGQILRPGRLGPHLPRRRRVDELRRGGAACRSPRTSRAGR